MLQELTLNDLEQVSGGWISISAMSGGGFRLYAATEGTVLVLPTCNGDFRYVARWSDSSRVSEHVNTVRRYRDEYSPIEVLVWYLDCGNEVYRDPTPFIPSLSYNPSQIFERTGPDEFRVCPAEQ